MSVNDFACRYQKERAAGSMEIDSGLVGHVHLNEVDFVFNYYEVLCNFFIYQVAFACFFGVTRALFSRCCYGSWI